MGLDCSCKINSLICVDVILCLLLRDVKILRTSPPGGTLAGGPESEISGSLKNLKPEKIDLIDLITLTVLCERYKL